MLYVLPLAARLLTSVQSGTIGAEPFATVAAVGLALGKLVLRDAAKAADAPWWAWRGGVLGAAVIVAEPIAAPRLGAPTFMGILATASVCVSILLDHFGLVGFREHTASWGASPGSP